MLKKTIKYIDFNGVEREEDFYFNLTKAELAELELGISGGLSEMLKKIQQTKDVPSIMEVFKKLLLLAYGEKSADGKHFMKSEEISNTFKCTEAYSVLFMDLATDADAASAFINGIIPSDYAEELNKKK